MLNRPGVEHHNFTPSQGREAGYNMGQGGMFVKGFGLMSPSLGTGSEMTLFPLAQERWEAQSRSASSYPEQVMKAWGLRAGTLLCWYRLTTPGLLSVQWLLTCALSSSMLSLSSLCDD